MNVGQMSNIRVDIYIYIHSLMCSSPQQVCSWAGALANVRKTRDGGFTHIRFHTPEFLDTKSKQTEKSLHRGVLHTDTIAQRSLLHREAFTQGIFYTQKQLHREAFYTEKSLHRGSFTHRRNCTEKPFTQKSLYTGDLLHTDAIAQRSLLPREVFIEGIFYT